MAVFADVWILLAVASLLSAQGFDKCITRDQQAGECRFLRDCPEAIKDLRKSLKPARCGFAGKEPIVCCRKSFAPTTDRYQETDNGAITFNNSGYDDTPWGRKTTGRPKPTPGQTTTTGRSVGGERKASAMCKQYVSNKPLSFGPQILRGENAMPGEFPHMAAIGYQEDAGLEFKCGGSLISDRFVLTAAHCIQVIGGSSPSLVRLGAVDLEKEGLDTTLTDFAIERSYVYDNYNRILRTNDIALLRLTRTVEFTLTIYPACLYTNSDNPTTMMSIAGWGMFNTSNQAPKTSRLLLKANVTAVSTASCNRQFSTSRFRENFPNGYLPSQMCAQDLNNISDTCPGDSGGPLQLPLPAAGGGSVYSVVGITSFGKTCGLAVPAVYTRVSSYLDWIAGIVWP